MNALLSLGKTDRRRLLICLTVFILLFFLLYIFRRTLADAAILIFGAAAVAFIAEPAARKIEKHADRPLAALCAILGLIFLFGACLLLLLPVIVSEAASLMYTLPHSFGRIQRAADSVIARLEIYLPGIRAHTPSFVTEQLPAIAMETLNIAGNMTNTIYRFSLMIVLGYFFLCDRDRILLRLELFIPRRARQTAVRVGKAICRDLKAYIRGQGMISAAVGALSAAGLAIVNVRSSLVLGLIVGIMNMIPYFGPVIGAIPAVLTALVGGWQQALWAAGILWLVQQIDGTLISPRIMSSISGVSPAIVLLALFVGARLCGIIGMLLAMPVVMTIRTVFRVFVQRYENI